MSKPSDDPSSPKPAESFQEFSPEQRKLMLAIAHEAIAARAAGRPLADWAALEPTSPGLAAMGQACGVFTTIYLAGKLRGCVGYAAAKRPLFQAVAETACAAAFEDSRFSPVSADEVPALKISLSVLSPLFPVKPSDVQVGRHGLVISKGLRRGLLLPQVSLEHDWDREAFLEQTCRKAGLPTDAWKNPSTVIEAFEAEVFSDELVGDDPAAE